MPKLSRLGTKADYCLGVGRGCPIADGRKIVPRLDKRNLNFKQTGGGGGGWREVILELSNNTNPPPNRLTGSRWGLGRINPH